jgi:hypothetical protein
MSMGAETVQSGFQRHSRPAGRFIARQCDLTATHLHNISVA